MNFTNYVEEKKKEARIKNIEILRKEIDSFDVREKIKNHVTAFEGIMSEEEVREGSSGSHSHSSRR